MGSLTLALLFAVSHAIHENEGFDFGANSAHQTCCSTMIVDDGLLKGRGAGIYKLTTDTRNGRVVYYQENGENCIYWSGEYWAIGGKETNNAIIYETTDRRRLFLRSYNEHMVHEEYEVRIDETIKSTYISYCPSDVGGWSIRIPFSTIWTYGHSALLGCVPRDETNFDIDLLKFDAESSGIVYGPGGTTLGLKSYTDNEPDSPPVLLESSFGYKTLPGGEVVTLVDPLVPGIFNELDKDDPRVLASSGEEYFIGQEQILNANTLNNVINKEEFRHQAEKCCDRVMLSGFSKAPGTIFSRTFEKPGKYDVINGKPAYARAVEYEFGEEPKMVMAHDGHLFGMAFADLDEFTVRAKKNGTADPTCPESIGEWEEKDRDGRWFANRYISVDCYYFNLLSYRGFYHEIERAMDYYGNRSVVMVRFFDENDESRGSNAQFDDIIDQIHDYPDYDGRVHLKQVDCTRDPVEYCLDANLPRVVSFYNASPIAEQSFAEEPWQSFMERSLRTTENDRPPRQCCSKMTLSNCNDVVTADDGTQTERVCNGIYNATSKVHNGKVLYAQHRPCASTDTNCLLNNEFPETKYWVYYDNYTERYCFGDDPTSRCDVANGPLMTVSFADNDDGLADLCPTFATEWNKPELTIDCTYDIDGVIKSSTLLELIESDDIKTYIIRFFDHARLSKDTHGIWNDAVRELNADHEYDSLVLHQIDCAAEGKFCNQSRVYEKPDILAYRGGKVVGYFTQRNTVQDYNLERLLIFLDEMNEVNPLQPLFKPPDITRENMLGCCSALIVEGDGLKEDDGAGIYLRQSKTHNGHIWYRKIQPCDFTQSKSECAYDFDKVADDVEKLETVKDDPTFKEQYDNAVAQLEGLFTQQSVYFAQDGFNMGDDTSTNHKKKIRSEVTYFRGIYEELGRSPCPEEIQNWGTWKYRNTDYEPWQEDKKITVHCSNSRYARILRSVQDQDEFANLDLLNPLARPIYYENFTNAMDVYDLYSLPKILRPNNPTLLYTGDNSETWIDVSHSRIEWIKDRDRYRQNVIIWKNQPENLGKRNDPDFIKGLGCHDSVTIKGGLLELTNRKAEGTYKRIIENYNRFPTYFLETEDESPAVIVNDAGERIDFYPKQVPIEGLSPGAYVEKPFLNKRGYYLFYMRNEQWRGWVIGDRSTYSSIMEAQGIEQGPEYEKISLYAPDNGYRLFARLKYPSLDSPQEEIFIERCPCALSDENWEFRLENTNNWLPRWENTWFMGIGGRETVDFSMECPSMNFVKQELHCFNKDLDCYDKGLAAEEAEAEEEEVTPVDARKRRSLPAVQDIPFIYDDDEEYYNSLVTHSRVRRGKNGRRPKTGKSTNQKSGDAESDGNALEATEELLGGMTPSPALDFSSADAVMMQSQQTSQRMADLARREMANFEAQFDRDTAMLVERANEDLEYIAEPIPEIELNMEPGSSINLDNDYMAPAPWQLTQDEMADGKADWGEDMGPSKSPMFMSTSLGKLMINDCYRKPAFVNERGKTSYQASATVDNQLVNSNFVDQRFQQMNDQRFLYDENTFEPQFVGDKVSCPLADNILNACNNIVDAAQYIGVTFDITKGYNTQGYRSQITKMWCVYARKFAKNRWDVPDFMHIQGVYQTEMSSRAYKSIKEWTVDKAIKANTQNGVSSFSEQTSKYEEKKSSTKDIDVGLAIETPSVLIDINYAYDKERVQGVQRDDFNRNQNTKRDAHRKTNSNTDKDKTEVLFGVLSIDIMRYQAYLDDVNPETIVPEFLDSFKTLPLTFYEPDAPELFQEFIDQWGTHIVKGANFGAKLEFVRTAINTGSVNANDFAKTVQSEFEQMTAANSARQTQDIQTEKHDLQGSVTGVRGDTTASAHFGFAKEEKTDSRTSTQLGNGTTKLNNKDEGVQVVSRGRETRNTDKNTIEAEGGSQKIAALLGDMYSPNFKSNLRKWLESVPDYPKPFNFMFVKLTDILLGLGKHFLDDDCKSQCAGHTINFADDKDLAVFSSGYTDESLGENSGTDFCTTEQKNHFKCRNPETREIAKCKKQCEAGMLTCVVKETQKRPCSLLKIEEEKWNRRVRALNTAIENYIAIKANNPEQSLVQNQDIKIQGGSAGCTTSYSAGDNLNNRIGKRPDTRVTKCATGDDGKMCRVLQGATAILSGDFLPGGDFVNVTQGFTGTNNAGDVDLDSTTLTDSQMEQIIKETLNPTSDDPPWEAHATASHINMQFNVPPSLAVFKTTTSVDTQTSTCEGGCEGETAVTDMLNFDQTSQFATRFDSQHQAWYDTAMLNQDNAFDFGKGLGDDIPSLPLFSSDQVPDADVRSATIEDCSEDGLLEDGACNQVFVKIPSRPEIEISNGWQVTANVDTKELVCNSKNLQAMSQSKNLQTQRFYDVYGEQLRKLCTATGTTVGFFSSPADQTADTPLPCLASFTFPQMYETTPNIQQCVYTAIQTTGDYFFVMTEDIGDLRKMIYVHQARDSLCIHQLDSTLTADLLNPTSGRTNCAADTALGSSEFGGGNEVGELYVCTNYLKEEGKLRIQVGRPNYNARNLEAATIVLMATIPIDETLGEGPPRFYAVGSGEADVFVKSIYMTKLDRVTCAPGYEEDDDTYARIEYQACDVPCHQECHGGCNIREEPRGCVRCEGDLLYVNPNADTPKECISSCTADYDAAGTVMPTIEVDVGGGIIQEFQTGTFLTHDHNVNFTSRQNEADKVNLTIFIATTEDISPRTGLPRSICRACNPECEFGCRGPSAFECIHPNGRTHPRLKGCRNVQVGGANGFCAPACGVPGISPRTYETTEEIIITVQDGNFLEQQAIQHRFCAPCHPTCEQCIDNNPAYRSDTDPDFATRYPGGETIYGYTRCSGTQCNSRGGGSSERFYKLSSGLGQMSCLDYCPPNYRGQVVDDKYECVPTWTVIGFQDKAFNDSDAHFPHRKYKFDEHELDDTSCTENCHVSNYEPTFDPLINFYDWTSLIKEAIWARDITADQTNSPANGNWKFKFEWQLENNILSELIWIQDFSPIYYDQGLNDIDPLISDDTTTFDMYIGNYNLPNFPFGTKGGTRFYIDSSDDDAIALDKSTAPDVVIESFRTFTCKERLINFDYSLDLAYFDHWHACAQGQVETESLIDEIQKRDSSRTRAEVEAEFKTEFKGLRNKLNPLNTNSDNNQLNVPQFPVLETWRNSVFFSFGHNWMYRDYLLPAYFIPAALASGNVEQEFALKVRLSVEDRRKKRTITMWTGWKGCENVCGKGKQEHRTRQCNCEHDYCYPCPVPIDATIYALNADGEWVDTGVEQTPETATLYKTEHRDCGNVNLCTHSEWTDFGNCVYHSDCCDVLDVTAAAGTAKSGQYSKIFVESSPYPVYKNVKSTNNDEADNYIHYRMDLQKWFISNNYWDLPYASDGDDTHLTRTDKYLCDRSEAGTCVHDRQAPIRHFVSRDILGENAPKCPNDVAAWQTIGTVDPVEKTGNVASSVTIKCAYFAGDPDDSNADPARAPEDQCPEAFPWAYDSGRHCCASPFEDFNDALGRACDGSPISHESKCCLNALEPHQFGSGGSKCDPSVPNTCTLLSTPCTGTSDQAGIGCVNNVNAEIKGREFSFLDDSNNFYRYSHRGCPDGGAQAHKDCGELNELSRFKICPNWLEWEQWTSCTRSAVAIVDDSNVDKNTYYTYSRKRARSCNTGNDDCANTPGLLQSNEEEKMCVHWLAWSSWSDFRMVGYGAGNNLAYNANPETVRGTAYAGYECPSPTSGDGWQCTTEDIAAATTLEMFGQSNDYANYFRMEPDTTRYTDFNYDTRCARSTDGDYPTMVTDDAGNSISCETHPDHVAYADDTKDAGNQFNTWGLPIAGAAGASVDLFKQLQPANCWAGVRRRHRICQFTDPNDTGTSLFDYLEPPRVARTFGKSKFDFGGTTFNNGPFLWDKFSTCANPDCDPAVTTTDGPAGYCPAGKIDLPEFPVLDRTTGLPLICNSGMTAAERIEHRCSQSDIDRNKPVGYDDKKDCRWCPITAEDSGDAHLSPDGSIQEETKYEYEVHDGAGGLSSCVWATWEAWESTCNNINKREVGRRTRYRRCQDLGLDAITAGIRNPKSRTQEQRDQGDQDGEYEPTRQIHLCGVNEKELVPAKFRTCAEGASNCPQDTNFNQVPVLESLYVFDCYGEQKASLNNGDLVNVNSLTHDDADQLKQQVANDPFIQSQVVKKYCEKLMESEVVYCLGQFEYPVAAQTAPSGTTVYHPQNPADAIHDTSQLDSVTGLPADTTHSGEVDNLKLMVSDDVIRARNSHSLIARKETYNPPNPTLK